MARRVLILAASALMGAVVAVACKKKEPIQYPANPPQDFTQDAGTTSAGDAAPPGVQVPVTDAAAAVSDAAATPLDLVTMHAMRDFLEQRARKEARGMKPHGAIFGGNVEEGGQVEQTLMIMSGQCISVLAMGGPGVTELDIQIIAKSTIPPFNMAGPVVAVDSNSGNEAAVSPCWKNVFPLSFPASVVIKATRGRGAIGGQVYVK